MTNKPLLAICALLALVFTGCATNAKLKGQASEVVALTDEIEARAYRCAPEELAMAKAYAEFGKYELGQGNFVRARAHLSTAEENARKADLLSDFDECRDKALAVKVDSTPTAKVVDAKPTPKDADGDGLLDENDTCPQQPEDFDKFEDEDGCPDPDNDQDGVIDEVDRLCPDVPEDKDGFEDNDGCPEFDNDLDGIADLNDNCTQRAEDYDGFQDDDGCPDPDNDDDSIVDLLDECVNSPEDYDNDLDNDGCPEERKLVKIEGDQIKLGQKVFFRTNKATILPKSYPLLDEVALVLNENPNIEVRVEGHTDSKGKDRYNKKLSQRRAESVRSYMAGRGVATERMEAIGFGEERPIEDNRTKEGRAKNRRVEIHITKK